METTSGPDGVRVAVAGEVDVYTAPRMRQALAAALARGEPVVADLAAVTFMDSGGLSALIATRRAADASRLTFRLQRVPAAVLRLLALTGLDAVLDVSPAPEDPRP